MRSLGLDIGDRRTGVAISDPGGILATPVTVLASDEEDMLMNEILRLVEQHKAGRIVIGLPRHLSGDAGEQAVKVTAFADRLSRRLKQSGLSWLEVELWDERFSTKAAEQLKAESDGRGGKGSSRARRRTLNRRSCIKADVDAIAASLILQDFLDSHRSEQ